MILRNYNYSDIIPQPTMHHANRKIRLRKAYRIFNLKNSHRECETLSNRTARISSFSYCFFLLETASNRINFPRSISMQIISYARVFFLLNQSEIAFTSECLCPSHARICKKDVLLRSVFASTMRQFVIARHIWCVPK